MKVKVKKLSADAILPEYQSGGAACFDIHSTTEGWLINPNEALVCGTGLAFEIPIGYVMKVYSRSGHAFKNNVRLSNCVGIIDSDFRGELKLKLTMDSEHGSFKVSKGDRIAQGFLEKVEQVTFEEVDELSETDRGEDGFGSTGQ